MWMVAKSEWFVDSPTTVNYRCGHPSQLVYVGQHARRDAEARLDEMGDGWALYAVTPVKARIHQKKKAETPEEPRPGCGQ